MKTAAIREMKAGLSRFVGMARDGESLAITSHGRVVAELRPPSPTDVPSDVIVRAVAPADRSWLDEDGPSLPAGTVAELLDADRGE